MMCNGCDRQVTITARQPAHVPPGAGPLYISQLPDASGNVTYLKRVEDVALQHYSSVGFPCGQLVIDHITFIAVLFLIIAPPTIRTPSTVGHMNPVTSGLSDG